MPERTKRFTGIVIRRTKLGESDSIVTFLDASGAQQRAVAKGSRKPSNTLSARLELYQTADVLCAQGKGLAIVKEARHVARKGGDSPASMAQFGLEQSACAAPIAELLWKVTQEDLEHPRLYDLVQASFSSLERAEVNRMPSICAATLLKVFAFIGLRPSLDACVQCGLPVELDPAQGDYPFTFLDGGLLCESCRRMSDAMLVDTQTLMWARALLYSTFDEIIGFEADVSAACAVLSFAEQWCKIHIGSTLKSVDFLLTSGIFA